MSSLARRTFLAGMSASALAACASHGGGSAAQGVRFGVSGPFSGDAANYGRVWKLAMDLAVDRINAAGGVRGLPLSLDYQDTQSDPKQSVAVAQQFADDPGILMELGDFSSAASIAASPIYERAGLVQFGFTNSDPKFTLGGKYMFSTATSVKQDAGIIARRAVTLGGKHAVVFQDTVWGRSAADAYTAAAAGLGARVVTAQSYLPDVKDFHAVLGAVRAQTPDVVVYYSYYTDGALLLQQARDVGLTARPVTSGAVYNQQFIELGGAAVEGVVLPVEFFAGDPRPAIHAFVAEYERRYKEAPDLFAAFAYDAVNIGAWAAARGSLQRDGVRQAMAEGKAIPSVVDGAFSFGPDRRVERAREVWLVVKQGKFQLADAAR